VDSLTICSRPHLGCRQQDHGEPSLQGGKQSGAAADEVQPKATALLYTTRTLGGTLGVSIGGSVQLGALASTLKTRFAALPNRDEVR
jgi:hypothetical protein